ncbi:MAG: GDP-fucose synthetase [Bdellovibrionales bacterium GWA1_52_35]|nr:MAG: GDP-fucose synthetase [Bdellovibrionales bacterium GWA1_52_35]HCM38642.1 GDP-fucose synthetase [Bdellovibrionales bacterium]
MGPDSRVFVAGHCGLVGSALVRCLEKKQYTNIVVRKRDELDLLNQSAVNKFFAENQIEFVFLAAAKVGGIQANNTYPADFLYENLVIETNVIHAAASHKVSKLLFLGSSCIYPREAPRPIREESLLTGPLEFTNEAYAIAKIAGLKMCETYKRQYGHRFISAMPTNLYGPFDNFHPVNSHVIPGMMRRFHEAKIARAPTVSVWGSGLPLREFLHVDELADALYLLMQKYEAPETINVGTGEDCSISELAAKMKAAVEYTGEVIFDPSKPDGTFRKVLEISKIKSLGWTPRIALSSGLRDTYQWALRSGVFSLTSTQ